MDSKICFKCLDKKPLGAFYKHSQMADGHLNKCKECTKNDVNKHRQENLEKIRTYDKMRSSMPHRVSSRRQITKAYSAKFHGRKRANAMLRAAVIKGEIKAHPCFVCGLKAVAHHPDYDRPLDVVWLCQSHHKQAHALTKSTPA